LLNGVNVYLIGMMGAGKTTVGRELANQLKYHFFDTDTLIEQVASQTINQIFTGIGEEGFRKLESQVLSEISAYTKLTIATGGGIVLKRENWSYLHHGLIVWLDAPVELLIERLAQDNTRPLLQDINPADKLQKLLEQRQRLYAEADIRISVAASDTPEQLSRRIIESIPQVLKPKAVCPENSNN
jgi:shikimate kinase